MAKRFDPPMPLAILRDAETMAVATGGIYRTAVTLLFVYWSGGCRDLPRDPCGLAALARMPQQNISPWLPAILAVLDEICPRLAAAYQHAKERYATSRENMLRAASLRHNALRQQANGQFPQQRGDARPTQRAAPYASDKADMHMLRQLASTRADAGSLLADKASLSNRR